MQNIVVTLIIGIYNHMIKNSISKTDTTIQLSRFDCKILWFESNWLLISYQLSSSHSISSIFWLLFFFLSIYCLRFSANCFIYSAAAAFLSAYSYLFFSSSFFFLISGKFQKFLLVNFFISFLSTYISTVNNALVKENSKKIK